MSVKRKVPFSQLWAEEEEFITKQSSLLMENAVVVEIGTAQGGSAYLFATAAHERNVFVYSYDISPSDEAFENLRGLNVRIIAESSEKGAAEWQNKYGKPVDLLFIDGSHTLENVYLDFVSWFPYLRTGGRILFHDYDPVHRGGYAHLGVKVFIDALRMLGILSDNEHVGRIFSGIKDSEVNNLQLSDGCIHAYEKIGMDVARFLEFDFRHCNFIGDEDDYLNVLRELRGFRGEKIDDINKISPENVVVLPHPLTKDFIEKIKERDILILLNEVIFLYFLYDSILNDRNRVLSITKNRDMYFKWEELLEMHNHSHNCEPSVKDIFNVKDKGIKGISRICARELVRLNILNNIFMAVSGKNR